jgi:hypothetical protein
MKPEFMRTKEWEEYHCDYLDEECFYSFGDNYGGGLKKGAPEWLVKAMEEDAERIRRLIAEEERTGIRVI